MILYYYLKCLFTFTHYFQCFIFTLLHDIPLPLERICCSKHFFTFAHSSNIFNIYGVLKALTSTTIFGECKKHYLCRAGILHPDSKFPIPCHTSPDLIVFKKMLCEKTTSSVEEYYNLFPHFRSHIMLHQSYCLENKCMKQPLQG